MTTPSITPNDLRAWADEYDDFDRRAGTLQAGRVGGGAFMLRQAAHEIERLDWLPISDAPEDEEVLMAAKPPGHVRWKFGVGSVAMGVIYDWPWSFAPTHFQRIKEPMS